MSDEQKILILGFSPENATMLKKRLADGLRATGKSCIVVVTERCEDALRHIPTSDVAVVNVDRDDEKFFEIAHAYGYAGALIAATGYSGRINKPIRTVGDRVIRPMMFHRVAEEILKQIPVAAPFHHNDKERPALAG